MLKLKIQDGVYKLYSDDKCSGERIVHFEARHHAEHPHINKVGFVEAKTEYSEQLIINNNLKDNTNTLFPHIHVALPNNTPKVLVDYLKNLIELSKK